MSAATGCSACNETRRNLVVVGENDEDRPSLSGTASELVGVLRAQVAQVKLELRADPTSVPHERRALALGNTLAKVLESSRKLMVDGVAAVENLSFAERAELFIGWVTGLPPAYRRSLRDRLDEWEATVARPVAHDEMVS